MVTERDMHGNGRDELNVFVSGLCYKRTPTIGDHINTQ